MPSLNKVTLIGHLGKDPEIRSLSNDNRVANLTIATSETWKDKQTGEKKEKTEWHRICIFNNNLVNYIEKYAKKGTLAYIEGQLQTKKWVDKEGKDNYTTEIVIQNFNGDLKLLSRSESPQVSQEPQPIEDEIPF